MYDFNKLPHLIFSSQSPHQRPKQEVHAREIVGYLRLGIKAVKREESLKIFLGVGGTLKDREQNKDIHYQCGNFDSRQSRMEEDSIQSLNGSNSKRDNIETLGRKLLRGHSNAYLSNIVEWKIDLFCPTIPLLLSFSYSNQVGKHASSSPVYSGY